MLGEALEHCFGAKLTIGPALEEGFYYDCYLGERTLTEADKAALEKRIQEVRLSANLTVLPKGLLRDGCTPPCSLRAR